MRRILLVGLALGVSACGETTPCNDYPCRTYGLSPDPPGPPGKGLNPERPDPPPPAVSIPPVQRMRLVWESHESPYMSIRHDDTANVTCYLIGREGISCLHDYKGSVIP